MVDIKKELVGGAVGAAVGAVAGPAAGLVAKEAAEALYSGLSKPWEMDPAAWWPLTSSNLDAFKYDKDQQELQIRFTSGRVYAYPGTDESTVQGLHTASSPGGYFHAHLKQAQFIRLS